MEPGFYENISFAEYEKIQAINCSRLVAYARTPAHALIKKEDTPAMRLGRAIHSAILEPDRYAKEWATMPEGMIRRGKNWETWQEKHKGAEVLSADEEASIKGIVASLASGYYETARKLLDLCKGNSESVLVWKHPKFGCLCKARLDAFNEEMGLITDLKSSANAEPDQWIKTAVNAKGLPHWQAHWYLQGAQAVIGEQFKTFVWVLVEIREPFGISVVQAAPAPSGKNDMVFLARLQIERTLERYLESERTGNFPGYEDKVVYGELPTWYVKEAL